MSADPLAAHPDGPSDAEPLGLSLATEDDSIHAGPPDPVALRRADIDAKQATLGRVLAELGCEGAVLFMPAHVAWFCGGFNTRGLIADTERPGIYTNGRQRWLLCANTDSQRLFDEEIDRLGFQLKEWQWATGRAALLGELVAGKKVAADRPFPGMPLVNDRLRTELRPLTAAERERYLALGKLVAHAVEATARTMARGQTEEEVAGQVAHRLYHHGVDAESVSVTADDRSRKYRRAGSAPAPVKTSCVVQAIGTRDGLYATAGRTVSFGPPGDELRKEYDAACRLSVAYRALSVPGGTVGAAGDAGRRLMADTPFEFEWRESQPGYGAGWFAAEELRRMGQDEKFVPDQAVVWQARVGAAALVDTVLVTDAGAEPVTPPVDWPYKRARVQNRPFDVPDLLVRTD